MKVIKRDGSEATFSKTNVFNAISKANQRVKISERFTNDEIKAIAKDIEDKCKAETHALNSEDIQDFVEDAIMEKGRYSVAREYITYRFQKYLTNQKNTTDDRILSILSNDNEEIKQENANKNPTIVSTMRDYLAGEVSKDISKRYLIPSDIVKAHEDGIIHFHDMDYFAQPIHNCFFGSTKFITSEGVRAFNTFRDGSAVEVMDKDGVWREATVHKYEKQKMNEITFSYNGGHAPVMKKVIATSNHRWYLEDGSVTTDLKVGDRLYLNHKDSYEPKTTEEKNNLGTDKMKGRGWFVKDISLYGEGQTYDTWCVEEPITHSFTLEDGIITGNCDLWNLEDMLQNGTVINGVRIDKPKTFLTACTIASQISAIIASSQYGGQTFTLSHLAPFVEDTRNYFRERLKAECPSLTKEQLEQLVESETRKNIRDGIQTLQYQLVTISSTNGQTPFVSICMYLNEVEDGPIKDDLAIIIEEVLRQRIKGIKNKDGKYFTNAFPKLLYVLEDDNIRKDGKYRYLSEIAAECTMKRMVPDYISEKKMKEQKTDKKGNGYCFPCMGCVDGSSNVRVKIHDIEYTMSFEDFWNRLKLEFNIEPQFDIIENPNVQMILNDVYIWDNKESRYVDCKLIIKNESDNWFTVDFSKTSIISPNDDFELS